MNLKVLVLIAACVLVTADSAAQKSSSTWTAPSAEEINSIYPDVENLYLDLHRNPELSLHERQTAAKLADRAKALGYEVTTGVGGNGIVAVLHNGNGPTVLLRTDMDALPVEEKTGLPYASKITVNDDSGATIHVMQACGHDIHMASWYGTAKLMATHRDRWQGTLILIGQPAEEILTGARAMLADGLLTRFPRPDFALAIHDNANLPAGKVGYAPEYAWAAADTVEITIFGQGGHGAQPQNTIDPVVIAARVVLALQTIVSRENNPLDPTVITVGTIHGGTKNNIIPDEVKLQLTVRSYKPEVRKHLLASIERETKGEAMAAGAPRDPLVKVVPASNAIYNDPKLTKRVSTALVAAIGKENVIEIPPTMVAEDFSELHLAGIPSVLLSVGGVEPAKFAAAQQSGAPLPGLHSSLWAPDYEPTLKTAITAETAALLELMGR
jgi:amidohydrolase